MPIAASQPGLEESLRAIEPQRRPLRPPSPAAEPRCILRRSARLHARPSLAGSAPMASAACLSGRTSAKRPCGRVGARPATKASRSLACCDASCVNSMSATRPTTNRRPSLTYPASPATRNSGGEMCRRNRANTGPRHADLIGHEVSQDRTRDVVRPAAAALRGVKDPLPSRHARPTHDRAVLARRPHPDVTHAAVGQRRARVRIDDADRGYRGVDVADRAAHARGHGVQPEQRRAHARQLPRAAHHRHAATPACTRTRINNKVVRIVVAGRRRSVRAVRTSGRRAASWRGRTAQRAA